MSTASVKSISHVRVAHMDNTMLLHLVGVGRNMGIAFFYFNLKHTQIFKITCFELEVPCWRSKRELAMWRWQGRLGHAIAIGVTESHHPAWRDQAYIAARACLLSSPFLPLCPPTTKPNSPGLVSACLSHVCRSPYRRPKLTGNHSKKVPPLDPSPIILSSHVLIWF
jgi:hypothetical protein